MCMPMLFCCREFRDSSQKLGQGVDNCSLMPDLFTDLCFDTAEHLQVCFNHRIALPYAVSGGTSNQVPGL